MCDAVAREDAFSLQQVPDWLVRRQQIEPWDDDEDDDDRLIKCHECYQKHKAQKAQIEEELMRIAWHPSRW